MPELPEVEVTRLGLHPQIIGKKIIGITVRQPKLRWTVPEKISEYLENGFITQTQRRGKYLLLEISRNNRPIGWLIFHFGMSGTLRLIQIDEPALVHDHIDLHLDSANLRLRDPRRFGAMLWHSIDDGPIKNHCLFATLGIEPMSHEFANEQGAHYLYQGSRKRQQSIKQLLISGRLVVGVGNIYANEALFHAGIHPITPAKKISLRRYMRLVAAIRTTLQTAIDKGGSSLRDFVASDGSYGHFQLDYMVYGRTGKPCYQCQTLIKRYIIGQRSSFFCPRCQRA